MNREICIGNRSIGGRNPLFVVAEISANHAQKFDRAVELINKAKECGADAVKFQTYTPDTLTLDIDSKYFQIEHPEWGGRTLYSLYQKAHTPWKWFKKLKETADNVGIVFFSTAFDRTSVDFLEGIGVPVHKISSFELVDLPLIEYAAKTGKPLILSTGMATIAEIREAVNAARKAGAKEVILLKCASSYPAVPEDMNLKTILHMKEFFKSHVGLSDHTLGIETSIAAVSLGAVMVEKHFTLSRKFKTPDSFFSIEPGELKQLVKSVRIAERALGKIQYGPVENEKKSMAFRKSLFAAEDIEKGEVFTDSNIRAVRPANGLKPKCLKTILGKKARKKIRKGIPLDRTHVGK